MDADAIPPEMIPPHNLDAERIALGCILRHDEARDDLLTLLTPEDFYFDAHQQILRAVTRCRQANRPVDLVTVAEDLLATKKLADSGGVSCLAELWVAAPTGASADYYGRTVKEYAVKRSLIRGATELIADLYRLRGEPAGEAAARFYTAHQDAIGGQVGAEPVSIRNAVTEAFHAIDARCQAGKSMGVPTGFGDLDQAIGGLNPGKLIILAARPSVGKTGFAGCIAVAAAETNTPVLFATLEMSRAEITERLVAGRARVNHRLLKHGRIGDKEMPRVLSAGDSLSKLPISYLDSPGLSVGQISTAARRMARRGGLGLIVIDYLTLLRPENERLDRHLQVGKMSRSLKNLSRELRAPILCLAQVSRDVDKANRRPRLSDLRESGDIEQDADVVMFLHRPTDTRDQGDQRDRCERIECVIEKNRDGPIGEFSLNFYGSQFRFETYVPPDVT